MADLQKLIAKQREELGIVKEQHIDVAVSYTHLTLPTNREV